MSLQAFISYKSEERPRALKLRDVLRSWGYSTWLDQDNIPSGNYFRHEIQAGLEASAVVVGIMSQAALKSREVLAEWDYAFSGKSRLLLLRYEPVELPYWLSTVQYIDCFHDENAALSQLQVALQQPDSSHYQAAPDYIRRSESKKRDYVYQVLVDERKADNRARMLENIYQAWILGALQPNLQAGQIDLGLGLKADAVLKHADYSDYTLPNTSFSIAQIFEDMRGELLILGEPGSGKTILLLQLAERLLALAQADEKRAIPIIINLASWAQKKEPLEKWLIEELKQAYDVPRKQAAKWLEQEKLCLLLDGLDEIIPSQRFADEQKTELEEAAIHVRSEAVAMINRFRERHPMLDMVICSRIQDYEALKHKLNLNGAILLQDLNAEQIGAYLAGDGYTGIRELLEKEATARELAKSPFILATMKSSYEDVPYTGSPFQRLKLETESQEERRNHLFAKYINKQMESYINAKYPRPETLDYLRWLAYQMLKREKTVFYIEDLQPGWAESSKFYYRLMGWQRIRFIDTLSWSLTKENLLLALLSVVFAGIIGWVISGLLGLIIASVFGLVLGTVFSFLSPSEDVKTRKFPNQSLQRSIENGLIFGLPGGLIFGLLIGLLKANVGLVAGLLVFLILGLIFGWLSVLTHIMLRLVLAKEGHIPRWRYDSFLDYTAQAGILRKIGGGYIFRHRMLLEYFAEQYQENLDKLR